MLEEHDQSRLRSLAAMARALGRPLPVPKLIELAAEETRRTLGAASVSVSRVEPDGTTVRTLVNVGDLGPDEERWPEDETYQMSEFAGLDLEAEHAWVWSLEDPDIPDSDRQLLTRLEKGGSVSAPIVVEGSLWGELYATRHRGERRFDGDDIAYLESLRAILAGALARAQREQSLTEMAYHDPLTGLLNRRALDERARAVFQAPAGSSREVAVVAVDINGLKLTNDREGHLAGDRLLTDVADRLQRCFSRLPGSLVARVGGDEFTVLVTDAPLSEVVALADELATHSWALDAATALSCGAAGVTIDEQHTVTPSELFAAADRALYVAKRGRRRKTVVATDLV